MKLNSDAPLSAEIRDTEIREHTVASQIKIGIPFQIRAMREHRGWTQEILAQRIGTTQNTISRLENPRTGKPTIPTLLRIAKACDVGLLVRFVPFSFYGDVIEAMDPTHVEIPSYEEELRDHIAASEKAPKRRPDIASSDEKAFGVQGTDMPSPTAEKYYARFDFFKFLFKRPATIAEEGLRSIDLLTSRNSANPEAQQVRDIQPQVDSISTNANLSAAFPGINPPNVVYINNGGRAPHRTQRRSGLRSSRKSA